MASSSRKVHMTPESFKKLQSELQYLKGEGKQKIAQTIAEARAFGDLSENAEYTEAKNKQRLAEKRIADLEDKLSRAEVIDIKSLKNKDTVTFGAHVTLIDCETEAEKTYQVVGEDESDIRKGLLSINSPLSRAILGQKEGDVVDLSTPRGMKTYEIKSIRYGV